jgi:hypothetical protein
MFPNVRLMIAATIASVVALSCGFAVFGALRVNHEPLARSAAPPLRLLASLSPSPPIMAAVEPFDRETRPSESSSAVDLADASARTPPANDQMAATPAAEPDATPVAANDTAPAPPAPPAPDAGAERETVASPAGIAGGASTPAPAQAPGVAAVPAPADQSVVIDEAGQETEFVPAPLPRPAAKPTKAAAKRKTARAHAAAKTRHARRAPPSAPSGVASSTTQESPPPPIGGPFVSPWAH